MKYIDCGEYKDYITQQYAVYLENEEQYKLESMKAIQNYVKNNGDESEIGIYTLYKWIQGFDSLINSKISEWKSAFKLLSQIIYNYGLKDKITLFRGLKINPDFPERTNHKIGDILTYQKNFLQSTSGNIFRGLEWADRYERPPNCPCCLYQINIKGASHGQYLYLGSRFTTQYGFHGGNEDEILLMPGFTYTVIDKFCVQNSTKCIFKKPSGSVSYNPVIVYVLEASLDVDQTLLEQNIDFENLLETYVETIFKANNNYQTTKDNIILPRMLEEVKEIKKNFELIQENQSETQGGNIPKILLQTHKNLITTYKNKYKKYSEKLKKFI
jgi:hypothetical protein